MSRTWLMVFSLLIPLAFAGGYLLATDSAWDTCLLQVPRERHGTPAVCGDISSSGTTAALFFGIVGVTIWALGWGITWRYRRKTDSSSS